MVFGLFELLVILLVAGVLFAVATRRLGPGGSHRRVRSRHGSDFESRVLDELEVLRLRMDALNDRLNQADLPDLPPDRGDPRLPGRDPDQAEGSRGRGRWGQQGRE